jgi:Fe-S cluster assembly iron-binding protein IscA
MMRIGMAERARALFEEERRRSGAPELGIQIAFLYGCGGAGFRVAFTPDPQGSHIFDIDGVRIAVDAESFTRLDGAIIEWEAGPEAGFVLRHPDAALVEFC